jgi:CRISPR system Cascade subunit CasC
MTERIKIELHILQNFAPSNLNRDDTGAPKSCEFGGYRRARVSSQSLKRAARTFVEERKLIDEANLGKRSELHLSKLAERIGKDRDGQVAQEIVNALFGESKIKSGDAGESKVLLYFGNGTIDEIVKTCEEKWSELEAYVLARREETKLSKDESGNKKKKSNLPQELIDRLKSSEEKFKETAKVINKILNFRNTADIALFGRMIADAPKLNQYAASQVAHAISTNVVSDVEIDYFTALDELKDKDDPGAAHINTSEFNSACYYRYANVGVKELEENLKDGGDNLTEETLRAFLQAFVLAVPSGKQNSFASPVPPSCVLAVIRNSARCSLANAFEKPITEREKENSSIIGSSVKRLLAHFNRLEELYGDFNGASAAFVFAENSEFLKGYLSSQNGGIEPIKTQTDGEEKPLSPTEVTSLKALIDRVITSVFPDSKNSSDDHQQEASEQ